MPNNENNRPMNNPAEKRQKDMPGQRPDRSTDDQQQKSGKDGGGSCGC
jgi:hypothetical protein